MLNQALLHKIKAKHPEYTTEQIKMVIRGHLAKLNIMLVKGETFNITIPKLGRIHTHGNAVSRAKIIDRNYHRKNMKRIGNFTDKRLLF